ncbi:MAG: hypothetical protein AAF481_04030 [Acidobacteriota bacterium]
MHSLRAISAGLSLIALGLIAPSFATAATCTGDVSCGFNPCKTPSAAPPDNLWSRLEPVDRDGLPTSTFSSLTSRDTTWFDRNAGHGLSKPYWQSMDIENGYLFSGINLGFQVWSLANPVSPSRRANEPLSSIPSMFGDPHDYFVIRDVDAPRGNNNLVTMTGAGAIGFVVWDTTSKSNPVVIYQDGGNSGEKFGEEVYATTINGTDYGFMAARNFSGAGLWMYDLSAALALGTSVCVERRPSVVNPSCDGVFKGKLSDDPQSHIDGTGNDTVGHWIVFSGGLAGANGFEVWNVSDPDQPVQVMNGLNSDRVHGGAMWLHGGRLYLAMSVRFVDQARIYDVSCLLGGGSCSLPAPIYSFPLVGYGVQSIATVTYSESNGAPFVYFGRKSGSAIETLQGEWLLDVSGLPAADPTTITGGDPRSGNLGQPTEIQFGTTVGYWSWYYSCHPTGSNFFEPADGMFAGPYFYRAGSSIFDIHELTDSPPNPVIFDSGFETGNLIEWSASEGD